MSQFDCYIYSGFGVVIAIVLAVAATPFGIMWG